MKNTSITKSLPALLTITGGAVIAASGNADASQAAQPERVNALETRVKQVQDKLGEQQQDQQQPGLAFEKKTTEDGLQTFWWGNWHNGGWGPGMWHNWGNGGWHNWRNGWGNGGWHNWHNWSNF